jgi:hypothetical protein
MSRRGATCGDSAEPDCSISSNEVGVGGLGWAGHPRSATPDRHRWNSVQQAVADTGSVEGFGARVHMHSRPKALDHNRPVRAARYRRMRSGLSGSGGLATLTPQRPTDIVGILCSKPSLALGRSRASVRECTCTRDRRPSITIVQSGLLEIVE